MRLALSVLAFFVVYAATEDHARSYDYFQPPYYAGANYAPVEQKFFRPTVTVTSTSVSTVTCTKSTAACVRRRRGIALDEDESNDEQFPIVPSSVQGVEATAEPSRDGRAADPQYLIMAPSFAYLSQQTPYNSAPFHFPGQYRPAQPYYAAYPQQQPQAQAGERLFWSLIPNLTATVTSTAFSIFTSTSTPACRTTGAIPQCPNN